MFVVSPVNKVTQPKADGLTTYWGVVFEDEEVGHVSFECARKSNREEAQTLADALNEVLNK